MTKTIKEQIKHISKLNEELGEIMNKRAKSRKDIITLLNK